MIIQQRPGTISSEKENKNDSTKKNECGREPGEKGIVAKRCGNKTPAVIEANNTVGNSRITTPSSNSIPGPASKGMCK